MNLYSFFFLLNLLIDGEPTTAGWEVHAGSITLLGTQSAYILADGRVLIDAGVAADGSVTVTVEAQSGSWVDEATIEPVFANSSFSPDGERPLFDLASAVYDLLNQANMP